VVVKGTLSGLQRGALRLTSGLFQTDRASEAPLTDAQLRARAASAGQELTYTCVPPGSGTRIGVDRDEDGFFDREELDAGSDPADPASIPAGATTTTSTTTPGGSTTTSTTLPTGAVTLVQATALKLTDTLDPPGSGKLSFSSSTKKDPTVNRIVIPTPGGPSDPRSAGVILRYYNSAGLTTDAQIHLLDAHGWTLLGSPTAPKGYRFRGKDIGDSVTKSATITADSIKLTGFSLYSLDEPAQWAHRRQDLFRTGGVVRGRPREDERQPAIDGQERPAGEVHGAAEDASTHRLPQPARLAQRRLRARGGGMTISVRGARARRPAP